MNVGKGTLLGMGSFTKGQHIQVKMGDEIKGGRFIGYSYGLGPLYSLVVLYGELNIRTVATTNVKEVKDEGK